MFKHLTAMSNDKFQPKSSYLEQAEYNDVDRTMTLTFKNGTSYRYLFVFPTVWLNFKSAENHSVYYSKLIKGKLLSVPLIKKNIGKRQSTPLQHIQANRSQINGNRINPVVGLIPTILRSYNVKRGKRST